MKPPWRADGPRAFLASLEHFGIKLGLSTIDALCDALGRPERACPAILIAGTNGKGSTAAFVDEALRAAGYGAGRYTSPHLIRLEERFHVNGMPVRPDDLDTALEEIRRAAEDLRARGVLAAWPTYFEVTTAAAFLLFARARLDVAVLEVGLGGRYDATNVVAPVATAITSIALDHERHLGSTLASIAAEKAGIVRPGVPLVAGDLPAEAAAIVADTCGARGAPLIDAMDGTRVETSTTGGVTTVRLRTPNADYGRVRLALRGDHQVRNAVVAVRLLETLEPPVPDQGAAPNLSDAGAAGRLRVPASAIRAGLEAARWPGRLDLRELADGRRALIDGAHNPAGAAALAAYLGRHHPSGLPLVFGAMADKDLRGMIAPLSAVSRPLILTTAPGARAADTALLASAAAAAGAAAMVEPDLERALATAWTYDASIAVAGSLYLAGAVLAWIEHRGGVPA